MCLFWFDCSVFVVVVGYYWIFVWLIVVFFDCWYFFVGDGFVVGLVVLVICFDVKSGGYCMIIVSLVMFDNLVIVNVVFWCWVLVVLI